MLSLCVCEVVCEVIVCESIVCEITIYVVSYVKLLYVKFVCVVIVCERCVVGGGGRRRRRRRSPGYRIKNKNPTQRCGEKGFFRTNLPKIEAIQHPKRR